MKKNVAKSKFNFALNFFSFHYSCFFFFSECFNFLHFFVCSAQLADFNYLNQNLITNQFIPLLIAIVRTPLFLEEISSLVILFFPL